MINALLQSNVTMQMLVVRQTQDTLPNQKAYVQRTPAHVLRNRPSECSDTSLKKCWSMNLKSHISTEYTLPGKAARTPLVIPLVGGRLVLSSVLAPSAEPASLLWRPEKNCPQALLRRRRSPRGAHGPPVLPCGELHSHKTSCPSYDCKFFQDKNYLLYHSEPPAAMHGCWLQGGKPSHAC